MAKPRQVKATGKDKDGNITSLKGAFGEVPLKQAIAEIKAGDARYAVGQSEVLPVAKSTGRKAHLRSAPDSRAKNNLDNLPSD